MAFMHAEPLRSTLRHPFFRSPLRYALRAQPAPAPQRHAMRVRIDDRGIDSEKLFQWLS